METQSDTVGGSNKPYARTVIYRSKRYKRARKGFRAVAGLVWIGVTLSVVYKQNYSIHEHIPTSKLDSGRIRIRRSDDTSSAQNTSTLQESDSENSWYKQCIHTVPSEDRDTDDKVIEWQTFYTAEKKFIDDKKKDKVKQQAGTTKARFVCCLQEEEERSHHQGAKSEFPQFGLFTDKQLKENFAWLVHLAVSLYMFAALAFVCDDYFVPALERVSEELSLSEDVAGATFMAAGSSAPELFTSMIGVFVAKSDIGIGTIVGSAVFNILVIIGACGLFVEGDIHLSVWPLFRDSMFYLFTIICLLVVIFPEFNPDACPQGGYGWNGRGDETWPCTTSQRILRPDTFYNHCECKAYDGISRFSLLSSDLAPCAKSEVFWYEATVMLIMYSFYILIMKYNESLEAKFSAKTGIKKKDASSDIEEQLKLKEDDHQVRVKSSSVVATPILDRRNRSESQLSLQEHAHVETILSQGTAPKPNMKFDDLGMRVMMSSNFAPKTRLRMAAKLVAKNPEGFVLATDTQGDTTKSILIQKKRGDSKAKADEPSAWKLPDEKSVSGNSSASSEEEDEEGPTSPWDFPSEGLKDRLLFILWWPINFTLWYTVPRCGEEEYKHLYMVSFIASTVWIAFYSYIMVWMVAFCGFALGIPDTIMGLTFLAAGTSVPDTIASVLVAKEGMGDMAVSNSIGSNVFDILLGLALPWTLQMIVSHIVPTPECENLAKFSPTIMINSSGLIISVTLLLLSLIFVVLVIHFNGWKLNTFAGLLISVAYAAFIVGSIYTESSAGSNTGTCASGLKNFTAA